MIEAIDTITRAQPGPAQPYAQLLLPPPDTGPGMPSVNAVSASPPSASQLARTLNNMERGIERQLEDPLRKIGRGDSSVQTAVELQMRMIRFEVWHEVVANSVKRLNGAIETLTR